MKKVLFGGVLTLGFVLASQMVMAAPPPSAVPVDGGLSLVLTACACYGAKKLYDLKK